MKHLKLFIAVSTVLLILSCDEIIEESLNSVTSSNESFKLDMTVDDHIITPLNSTSLAVTLTRMRNRFYNIDPRIFGVWEVTFWEWNGDTIDIARFPRNYEIYDDFTFSVEEINTIDYSSNYVSGGWKYDTSESVFSLILEGDTTDINLAFDIEGDYIPFGGYMYWQYEGSVMIMKKAEDINILDDFSKLRITTSGGILEGLSHNNLDSIAITLNNEAGSKFQVSGVYYSDQQSDEGIIEATMNDLTIQLTITTEYE